MRKEQRVFLSAVVVVRKNILTRPRHQYQNMKIILKLCSWYAICKSLSDKKS